MKYYKRAVLYLLRSRSHVLLIFCMLFATSLLFLIPFMTHTIINNSRQYVHDSTSPTVTVSYDFEKFQTDHANKSESEKQQLLNNRAKIGVAEIEALGALDAVAFYDYSLQYTVYSDGYQHVVPDEIFFREQRSFSLHGVQYEEIIELAEGKGVFVAGRHFTKTEVSTSADVVVIAEAFATENNLIVGDVLYFTNEVKENLADMYTGLKQDDTLALLAQQEVALEIIGIFNAPLPIETVSNEPQILGKKGIDTHHARKFEYDNMLYTPNKIVERERVFMEDNLQGIEIKNPFDFFTTTFVLDSLADTIAFQDEAKNILGNDYIVQTAFDEQVIMLEALDSFSALFSKIVRFAVIVTIILVGLLCSFLLIQRKAELRTYIALGEQKQNLHKQFFIEMIIIMLCLLPFTIVANNYITNKMTTDIILHEIEITVIAEDTKIVDPFALKLNRNTEIDTVHVMSKSINENMATAKAKILLLYALIIIGGSQSILYGFLKREKS